MSVNKSGFSELCSFLSVPLYIPKKCEMFMWLCPFLVAPQSYAFSFWLTFKPTKPGPVLSTTDPCRELLRPCSWRSAPTWARTSPRRWRAPGSTSTTSSPPRRSVACRSPGSRPPDLSVGVLGARRPMFWLRFEGKPPILTHTHLAMMFKS